MPISLLSEFSMGVPVRTNPVPGMQLPNCPENFGEWIFNHLAFIQNDISEFAFL